MIRLYPTSTSASQPNLIRLYSRPITPTSLDLGEENQSFLERNFPETLKRFSEIELGAKPVPGLERKAIEAAKGGLVEPFKRLRKHISDIWYAKVPQETKAQKVAATLETLGGVAGVAFSPITTLFAIADEVPILQTVSKTIGTAFTALGEAGSGAVEKIIDTIPENIMPKDVKETLKPGLKELGGLATQIALGKLGGIGLEKIKVELTKKYGVEDAKTIVEKAQEIAQKKPVTPAEVIPKDLEPLAQEARKYKSVEEFVKTNLKDDFLDQYKATQDMAKEMRSNGLKPNVGADGTITIYHGTTAENAKTIFESGKINEGSYFSPNKYGTDYYSKTKGKGGESIAIKVDPRAIQYGISTGEIFAEKGLVRGTDGVWHSPDRKSISQLTDFYNQVTKGVTAETTQPKIRLYPEETIATKSPGLPTIEPITIRPETKIAELQIQISQLRETLDASPYKQLSKYAGRNNELPEVVGYGKSEYARRGDQIITELGIKDTNEAYYGYAKYLEGRKRLDALKNELKTAKGESFSDYSQEQLDKINALAQSAIQGVREVTLLEPLGTGKAKIKGLSLGVEEKAIENKLTTSFGDLPEYRTVNMAEQSRLARDFLNKDYERAKRVALGRDLPPTGILPESLFVAIENRAIKTGDITTLRDLATQSGLVGEATAMGQRIRTLAERDVESPVTAMADVKRARMERVKEPIEAQRRIKDNIREEIKKIKPTKEAWATFIDSLVC